MAKEAEYYNKIFARPYNTRRYQLLYSHIGLLIKPGVSVVDLGCGTGDIVPFLPPKAQYRGFDFSEEAIKYAKEWHPGTFEVADLRTLEIPKVDVVICVEALEHLEDDIGLLERIAPGTQVIFTVPSFPDPGHVRTYTMHDVVARFKHLVRLQLVIRFNWLLNYWTPSGPETPIYILLVAATRLPLNPVLEH